MVSDHARRSVPLAAMPPTTAPALDPVAAATGMPSRSSAMRNPVWAYTPRVPPELCTTPIRGGLMNQDRRTIRTSRFPLGVLRNVALRLGVEFGQTACTAEVIGPPSGGPLSHRTRRIHQHAAHRIFFHGRVSVDNPPPDRGSRGRPGPARRRPTNGARHVT